NPLSRSLLFTGDRLGRTLTGTRIGVGALAPHRQPLAVPQATIAAQIHQPLDVHCTIAAQVALSHTVAIDGLATTRSLVARQLVVPPVIRNADAGADFLRLGRRDPTDVGQRGGDALTGRDIDASDTCHAV